MKKPPFVYFVIRNLWGIGGAEGIASLLASELAKKGCEVKILTSHKGFFIKRHINANNADVPVVSFSIPDIRFLGTMIYYFVLAFYLASHRLEYRVIQVFFLKHSAFVCALVGKALKKKIVCRLEGAGKCGDIMSLGKIPFSQIFLKIFRKVDVFIALTLEMRDEIVASALPKKRIAIIPNGVDTKKFFPVSLPMKKALKSKLGLPGGKIITFAGRLIADKGLDYLIGAFEKLSGEPLFLLIVGEGPSRETLLNKVKAAGLDEKVIFTGLQKNVYPYLQSSDIFVLPSHSEGLSVALLEAMSCGLPVIATAVSGNIELVKNDVNGFLVEPGDSKGLAEAIKKMLTNEDATHKMGRANREKIVEGYSIEKVVDQYIGLYTRLAGKNANG